MVLQQLSKFLCLFIGLLTVLSASAIDDQNKQPSVQHSKSINGKITKLPSANNLANDAKTLPQPGLIVVLYSRGECPYCEKVRKNNLLPLLKQGVHQNVLFRQINLDSDEKLIDFSGKSTTHSEFAKMNKISLVPVVAFFGNQGQSVSKPLVGALLDDFYQAYLDNAINEGLKH